MHYHDVAKAIESLKAGKLIIVTDDRNRENEGDLVGLADFVTNETVNVMITKARGVLCAPVSSEIAERLDLKPMVESNSDSFKTAFTVSIDHKSTSTGISAQDRALTIKKLCSPNSSAKDFNRPGHIFPIIAKKGGVLVREGHTEASIDLARLANATPVAYICEITNPDGTMARTKELKKLAKKLDIDFITVEDIINYRYSYDNSVIKLESSVYLPTSYGDFTLNCYSSIADNREYLALMKGDVDQRDETVLVRIHSECFTGDVMGSYRCDCKEQLDKSLQEIQNSGCGVLIYLRQEGRGIGLLNKLKAYELQEQGLDTVDANLALGLPVDGRNYGMAAAILHQLRIENINLITNNPYKLDALKKYGIHVVERVALKIPARKENKEYLKTKKNKLNHLF